jgi:hypothetical protein
VTPTTGLVTTEAGGTATVTARLSSQPVADVVIPVSSSDLTEGTLQTPALTFTAADWDVPQTVTVTGADDFVKDGDRVTIPGAATSADPNAPREPRDRRGENRTTTSPITVALTAGLVDRADTATFTVVLTSSRW